MGISSRHSCRTIHNESTDSLSADAFIQALYFGDLYQKEIMFESSEQITGQAFLGPVQN